MLLLRSLLFFACMVVGVIIVAPLVLLSFPLPLNRRYAVAGIYARWCLWALHTICRLDHALEGRENIPDGACIIMSKHQSAWETLALQVIFSRVVFVMKRELLWLPLFGWAMWLLRPIAIDRRSGRAAVRHIIKQGTWHLREGRHVVIFPEGTRTAPGTRKRYGVGGAVLGTASGFPIVPVAHNAGEFWRRRGIIKYPGTISVVVGPAIATAGRKPGEVITEVEDWIESTVARIQHVASAPPPTQGAEPLRYPD